MPNLTTREVLDVATRIKKTGDPGLLASVVGSGSSFLLKLAAEHPATPAETLDQLAYARDSHVRLAVVNNPNLPAESVERIAQREKPGGASGFDNILDYRLTQHPNLTWRGMWALISEWAVQDPDIVLAIIGRNDVTAEVLEHAVKRSEDRSGILSYVIGNQDYPETLVRNIPYQAEYNLALHTRYGHLPEWEEVQSLSNNWRKTIGELLDAAQLVRR